MEVSLDPVDDQVMEPLGVLRVIRVARVEVGECEWLTEYLPVNENVFVGLKEVHAGTHERFITYVVTLHVTMELLYGARSGEPYHVFPTIATVPVTLTLIDPETNDVLLLNMGPERTHSIRENRPVALMDRPPKNRKNVTANGELLTAANATTSQ